MSYIEQYNDWCENPDEFWITQSKQIAWYREPESSLNAGPASSPNWFADGEINTCHLALDHHVQQGRGEQIALIYDSPVTSKVEEYSFSRLLELTSRFSGVLRDLGVSKGDTVIIYMPMIPQAAIAMLACARLGAIHSVVFGGFAGPELASRIKDAEPKVILTASCGIEVDRIIPYMPMVREALSLVEKPVDATVVFQRSEHQELLVGESELDWQTLANDALPAECVPVNSSDPLYILYTSGTTGKPKGVVRDNGGHAVALNYSLTNIFGVDPGDVFWSASDVGWVVGHSYIVYGPLIRGCTSIFYEGKPVNTPDSGAFWRVVEQHNVNVLFSAPTAFRAIRREDPEGRRISEHDLSSLRHVFAAGERLDPTTLTWMQEKIGVPVVDNWWQTETGWPIAANPVGIQELAVKPGSATVPSVGYRIEILSDQGNRLAANQHGKIALKLPLPPGCMTTIWRDDLRFNEAYLSEFPGYYCSGDGGYIDEDGYLFVMGRVDDVINIAGHRLSTGDLEEIISKHDSIAECAVVAAFDELKGEIPIGFVVLKEGEIDGDVCKSLVSLVRKELGAIACYKQTFVVSRLPKTRSGKILRKTLKMMLNDQAVTVPPTIDDPSVLDEIAKVIAEFSHS